MKRTAVAPASRAPWVWATAGALLGLMVVPVLLAPARWLTAAIEQSSGNRIQFFDPRGSVWDGSAQLVLTGGAGSVDAVALPGRISWRLRPIWRGATAHIFSDCCTREPLAVTITALGKQGVTDAILTDLPGYGYAAVPKQDKIRWQQVMANYLITRKNLMGIVLMCDPRHGLTELDEILLDVVRPRVQEGLKFLIVLTKSDKLTRSEATKALSITKLQAGGGEVMLFSAPKRKGIDDVAKLLWQWAHPEVKAAAALAVAASEPPAAQ